MQFILLVDDPLSSVQQEVEFVMDLAEETPLLIAQEMVLELRLPVEAVPIIAEHLLMGGEDS